MAWSWLIAVTGFVKKKNRFQIVRYHFYYDDDGMLRVRTSFKIAPRGAA